MARHGTLALKEIRTQQTQQRKDHQTSTLCKKSRVGLNVLLYKYVSIYGHTTVYGRKKPCDDPTKFWLLLALRQDATTMCPQIAIYLIFSL